MSHSRLCLLVLLLVPLAALHAAERATEVCIYGGTASGLLSAIAVAKGGHRVLVIEPSRWLGGMTGGGIWHRRDCAYPNDIGGLTKMMLREDDNLSVRHAHRGQGEIRKVWLRLMQEHKIQVIYEHRLKAVHKDGARIVRIELEKAPPEKDGCPAAQALSGEGIVVAAKVFIDASYEGDLRAKAGVRYAVGRESSSQYGESLGGIRPIEAKHTCGADPFIKPGDPSSGLLPFISTEPLGKTGDASRYFIAYNFRLNGTRKPVGAPDHFQPERCL